MNGFDVVGALLLFVPPSEGRLRVKRRVAVDATLERIGKFFGGDSALHAVSWLKHYLQMVGRVSQPRHERVRDVVGL